LLFFGRKLVILSNFCPFCVSEKLNQAQGGNSPFMNSENGPTGHQRAPTGIRKRCDTWHGKSQSPENPLEASIAEGLNTKRKFARKNPWGYCSYADLITMALERAPCKQLTLAEIYDWIVGHIPYFYDKGDANSSIGWKNSIRHNLSLHEKFSRVPHNGTTQNAKNIGAYWTLVNECDIKEEKKQSMSPPPRSRTSPPTNIRKRASTMPTNMNYTRKPKMTREKRFSSSNNGFDQSSTETGRDIDSGIDRLSRQSSLSSLNVTEEMGRINLDASPLVKCEQNLDAVSMEMNMENFNKYNRDAKINPDNSVLVEVRLTAEQYELVSSGKYIVSLCDARTITGDSKSSPLRLPNWKTSNGIPNTTPAPKQRHRSVDRAAGPSSGIPIPTPMSHPFSPHSSESSGMGNSYSPPHQQLPDQSNGHTMDTKSVPRSQNFAIPDSSDIQFINGITGDNLFDQFELPDMDLAEILDH
jgi:hypothetical protein